MRQIWVTANQSEVHDQHQGELCFQEFVVAVRLCVTLTLAACKSNGWGVPDEVAELHGALTHHSTTTANSQQRERTSISPPSDHSPPERHHLMAEYAPRTAGLGAAFGSDEMGHFPTAQPSARPRSNSERLEDDYTPPAHGQKGRSVDPAAQQPRRASGSGDNAFGAPRVSQLPPQGQRPDVPVRREADAEVMAIRKQLHRAGISSDAAQAHSFLKYTSGGTNVATGGAPRPHRKDQPPPEAPQRGAIYSSIMSQRQTKSKQGSGIPQPGTKANRGSAASGPTRAANRAPSGARPAAEKRTGTRTTTTTAGGTYQAPAATRLRAAARGRGH